MFEKFYFVYKNTVKSQNKKSHRENPWLKNILK